PGSAPVVSDALLPVRGTLLARQKPSNNPTTIPQAVTIQKAAPARPISFAKPDAATAQNTTLAAMRPSASPVILAVCTCCSVRGGGGGSLLPRGGQKGKKKKGRGSEKRTPPRRGQEKTPLHPCHKPQTRR